MPCLALAGAAAGWFDAKAPMRKSPPHMKTMPTPATANMMSATQRHEEKPRTGAWPGECLGASPAIHSCPQLRHVSLTFPDPANPPSNPAGPSRTPPTTAPPSPNPFLFAVTWFELHLGHRTPPFIGHDIRLRFPGASLPNPHPAAVRSQSASRFLANRSSRF